MRTYLLTALLALAACNQPDAPAPTAPVEPLPIPSKPPLVEPPAAPVSMGFVDAGGVERLQLACREDAPAFRITVPGFRSIGSEDRLTLGVGDEAFAHAADLEASGPGVTGGGPLEADLLDRLARGEPVRAVYGAQSIGPLQAGQPSDLPAFTQRCRGLQTP
ncbi:hypothetical protein GGQ87_000851 [Brevundimonas alba]|uniref:Lipoprotein n=1 Tax=Brevundimonas alba TaxID=74314 RepID=A0A7X5YIJ2_9CAUL|nr:hypothetical protein [Brevundimonas alba]NJC40593.1 hypothetical protein [Brevundimonas alba]